MKQCSKQSAELCKSEKGIWRKMDRIDEQCDESIMEVNEGYNKAVSTTQYYSKRECLLSLLAKLR